MRVAIIGAGKVAGEHIRAYQHAGVEIAAIMSRTKEGAQKKADEYKLLVPVYDSLEELYANEEFHIVSITSPPEEHAAQILFSIEHDMHILVEKPAFLDLKSADQITLELLKRKYLKTRVSFVLRWNDLIQNNESPTSRAGRYQRNQKSKSLS